MPARRDWSLHRKGPVDQARHEAKVREALLERLDDIVCDPGVIDGTGKVVRVPVYSLKEHRFRFDAEAVPHVAQGDGTAAPGQIVGRQPRSSGAGTAPGEEVIEVEVSVEALEEAVLSQLGLPESPPRAWGPTPRSGEALSGVRTHGPMSVLDRRRSVRENLLRHARQGQAHVGAWSDDDLRFRGYRERPDGRCSAAVIAMRDASGSMGDFKKLAARSFFFWMTRFLQTRYDHVELAFIVHHVEAREVDPHTFLHLAESGGTRVSAAYELALQIMRDRFAGGYSVYTVHFSDGDNWGDADNRRCVGLMHEILDGAAACRYAEINEGGYPSPLMRALSSIEDPRWRMASIRERRGVFAALRECFPAGA